jgi:hypothetical protein
MCGSGQNWKGVAVRLFVMNDSATVKEYCRDEFLRVAEKLREPLTDTEADALEAELARIRAMFVVVDSLVEL